MNPNKYERSCVFPVYGINKNMCKRPKLQSSEMEIENGKTCGNTQNKLFGAKEKERRRRTLAGRQAGWLCEWNICFPELPNSVSVAERLHWGSKQIDFQIPIPIRIRFNVGVVCLVLWKRKITVAAICGGNLI